MPLPSVSEARPFYRSARERYDDATALYGLGRTTGAVYLAGYAVECIIKALLLTTVPVARRAATVESFRGNRGHDLVWLRGQYLFHGGPAVPTAVLRAFVAVNKWHTVLRYDPGTIPLAKARQFLRATEGILAWAEGRF